MNGAQRAPPQPPFGGYRCSTAAEATPIETGPSSRRICTTTATDVVRSGTGVMYVRPATPEDRTALPALHTAAVHAFGPGNYDAEAVRRWAKADDRAPADYETDAADEHFTVALREGDVAGFGHLVPGVGEVHAVYVHPDHARHGVGSALLAELEGYARGRGLAELALQSSLNAVGFYERAGYERVGKSESPGGLPVVEMEKSLRVTRAGRGRVPDTRRRRPSDTVSRGRTARRTPVGV